jgi:hypothetical protein
MSAKAPPIPAENQPRKEKGNTKKTEAATDHTPRKGRVKDQPDPESQGQQANTRQNAHPSIQKKR